MNIRGNCVAIDPTHLSKDDQMILAYFIKHTANPALLYEKDKTYSYPAIHPSNATGALSQMTSLRYSGLGNIKFTHRLARRERHSNVGYRYDVYGDKIGQGAYGSVLDIVGTLEYTYDGLISFQKNIHRVGKQLQYAASFIKGQGPEAISEYVVGRKVGGLHMHKPVFFPVTQPQNDFERMFASMTTATQTGLVVMRYVPGEKLSDALKVNGSVDARLKIAVATMRSLRELHQQGIVHRDIKPDNMKVEWLKTKANAYWFDFNGSRLADVNDGNVVYTAYYESPEVHLGQLQTPESDVFSLACMLARDIFAADENPAKVFMDKVEDRLADKRTSSNKYFKLVEQAKKKEKNASVKCKFKNMFNSVEFNDLNKEHKKCIKEKLSKMVSKAPGKRPSLDDAIMLFEQVLWERRLAKVSREERGKLLYARTVAEQLPIRIISEAKKAANASDRAGAAINEISKVFQDLDKNPAVIATFAEYLDTTAFAGVETEEAFREVLKVLFIESSNLNLLDNEFSGIKDRISHFNINNKLHWLEQEMKMVNRKIDRMCMQDPMTALNELTSVNLKLRRHREKISEAIVSLEADIQPAKKMERVRQAELPQGVPNHGASNQSASNQGVWSYVTSTVAYIGSFFGGGSKPAIASAPADTDRLSSASVVYRRP